MKNVVLYLKSRIKVIVMLVVIAIVQFVVFYLYSVPVAPVIYSLELLSFMLAVAVVFDYMAFYRRLSTAFCVMRFFRLNYMILLMQ